jgi:hypothetical protein
MSRSGERVGAQGSGQFPMTESQLEELRKRPRLRPDGVPTRCDQSLMTPAELAITAAMQSVEAAGASDALTEAVTLLAKARDRVADHVEEPAS